MKDGTGREVKPGLYYNAKKEGYNPESIEIYSVREVKGKLNALDIDGEFFQIEDSHYHCGIRDHVIKGTLGSSDLIPVDKEKYKELNARLLGSQKRISKLLRILHENKDNLSEQNSKRSLE